MSPSSGLESSPSTACTSKDPGQSPGWPSLKVENKSCELLKLLLGPCLGACCPGRLQNVVLYQNHCFLAAPKMPQEQLRQAHFFLLFYFFLFPWAHVSTIQRYHLVPKGRGLLFFFFPVCCRLSCLHPVISSSVKAAQAVFHENEFKNMLICNFYFFFKHLDLSQVFLFNGKLK